MSEPSATPRVDACIAEAMARHHSFGKRAGAAYYEEVHQQLAPLARELERALAAAEKERDEAKQQRGTLIGRQESGAFTPSPLGEQLLQMEQRALAAEAREREAYEGAAKVCFKHASPAMADACAAAIRALAKERT